MFIQLLGKQQVHGVRVSVSCTNRARSKKRPWSEHPEWETHILVNFLSLQSKHSEPGGSRIAVSSICMSWIVRFYLESERRGGGRERGNKAPHYFSYNCEEPFLSPCFIDSKTFLFHSRDYSVRSPDKPEAGRPHLHYRYMSSKLPHNVAFDFWNSHSILF